MTRHLLSMSMVRYSVMRERLAAGEVVARMYQEPGLPWLARQAEAAEDLLAERRSAGRSEASVRRAILRSIRTWIFL